MEQTISYNLPLARKRLLEMAELVECALGKAVAALGSFNERAAKAIIADDKAINQCELDIDKLTYSILNQKMAASATLRQLLSIERMNSTLERIGDHTVNIAESVITFAGAAENDLFELPAMGEKAVWMLDHALRSFFEPAPQLAEKVIDADDEMDRLNKEVTSAVRQRAMAKTLTFDHAMEVIRVSKNLERIGDLATNIAEETYFTVLDTVVKHAGCGPRKGGQNETVTVQRRRNRSGQCNGERHRKVGAVLPGKSRR